ncbi:MAG: hypothetical protein MRT15_08860 [archaeon YNP-LCB-003-016]|uniref:hypothetical protein n=1 Tax=Candidatus Culexarchaeum yellowstonense TaxID=2928963 RepID=UPI0026EA4980|nr:hypothetical protein [Candidatus Culexarchaeum yellowstonense]MCR6692489.1 hypothetical protein [Candidatus Culexarchaeum yellowstonense]
MEDVVEYVFAGFMIFLLFSSSASILNSIADRYLHMTTYPNDVVINRLLYSIAPGGRIDPLILQALSPNYSQVFGYYLDYEYLRGAINMGDYIFSIQISPPLDVKVDFKDESIIIRSFNVIDMKPCGSEAFVYLFYNGTLNDYYHIILDNGFGSIPLKFKPQLMVVFVRYGQLFGIGLYGDFKVNSIIAQPMQLYLSSFGGEYCIVDGVLGSSSTRLLDENGISFYSRVFSNPISISNGSLEFSIFASGLGDLHTIFGVCGPDYNGSTILANYSFTVNSTIVKNFTFNVPLSREFQGSNVRLFLKLISSGKVYVYFGGWNYPSTLRLNNILSSSYRSSYPSGFNADNIWLLWFDKSIHVNTLPNAGFPYVVVYVFNGVFHVAFIPELKVSIGFLDEDCFTYSFLRIGAHHLLLCKIGIGEGGVGMWRSVFNRTKSS